LRIYSPAITNLAFCSAALLAVKQAIADRIAFSGPHRTWPPVLIAAQNSELSFL
jgi:hypothetical protein